MNESLWSGKKSSKNYIKWHLYLEVIQLEKETTVQWFHQCMSQYLNTANTLNI